MIKNATIKLREPIIQTTATDDLRLEHTKLDEKEYRCWIRPTSISVENAVLGQAAIGMYRARIGGKSIFSVGWYIDAKIDGESEFHHYRIQRVVPNGYHSDLIIERVD